MTSRSVKTGVWSAAVVSIVAQFGIVCGDDMAPTGSPPVNSGTSTPASVPAESERAPTVAAARERARLMHDLYASTLDVMHDRYFHGDRAMVPARAMEDIFDRMEKSSRTQARWISVNANPMSVNHEPRSDFEKKAATALAAGKGDFEAVEGQVYRRAAPIPLTGGCISCHTGFFKDPPKTPRFAGLVISMPVSDAPPAPAGKTPVNP